jgi:predicted negative regulator of RcsB-dependent stress response
MKKTTFNTKDQLIHYLQIARKNAAFVFCVFLLGIYGFLSWQILTLLNAEPDQSQISSELETIGVPKVDPSVVSKMQKLEDNSVSVHSLFDDARSNPFKEVR